MSYAHAALLSSLLTCTAFTQLPFDGWREIPPNGEISCTTYPLCITLKWFYGVLLGAPCLFDTVPFLRFSFVAGLGYWLGRGCDSCPLCLVNPREVARTNIPSTHVLTGFHLPRAQIRLSPRPGL